MSSTNTDGFYRSGTTVTVTVAFNEAVSVNTGAGTPSLLLETGTTDRTATYFGGSGTSTLTFRYVPQTGDIANDLDYASTSALSLNGGIIRDTSDNDATLTLPSPSSVGSLAANKALRVDTVPPSAPSSLAATGFGGTVVANTLLASNTNMTASASITAGQAEGGKAELLLGTTVIATDASISNSDTAVNFSMGHTSTVALQADVAAGGSLSARLIDAAGNISSASTAITLTVDYQAPTITLSSTRSSLSIGQTSTITATLSEVATNFVIGDISVIGGTVSAFSGSGSSYSATFTPTNSQNALTGSVSVSGSTFTDAAGNPNSASAVLSVNIDTLAPAAPTVSGSSPVKVASATPTVSGTAEANASVAVFDNSVTPAEQIGSGTAAADGTWSVTVSSLTDGDHSITAVATDAFGNESNASSAKTWRVDTTPPNVSFVVVAGNDVVTLAEKDSGVTLTGSVEAGSAVTVGFAGVTRTATVTSTTWTYQMTNTDWTAVGTTSPIAFTVTAADEMGNTAQRSRSVTLNLVAVAVPGTPTLEAADDSGSRDNTTSTRTLRLNVALSNSGATLHRAGQLLTLLDGSGAILSARTLTPGDVTAGTYQFSVGPLDDGTYAFTAKAQEAGNSASSTSSLTVVVDNRVPGTPGSPDLKSASDSGVSNSDNVTSVTRPTFSIAVNGVLISGSPLVEGDTILLLANGSSVSQTTLTNANITSGIIDVQPDATLVDGSYTFTAKARSGTNVEGAASTSISVLIDTTSQSAPGVPDLVTADDTGASGSDNITSIAQPRFEISLTGLSVVANDEVELINSSATVIGSTLISSADISAGAVTITPTSPFAEGSISVRARVKDRAGNQGTASASITITINTSLPAAPTLSLAASSDSGTSSSDRITSRLRPTFTGTGTSGDVVKLFDGSTEIASGTVVSGNWSITPTTDLTDATYTLRVQAIDSAGNASSYSAGLVVTVDTTRPPAPFISGSPIINSNSATPQISGTAQAGSVVRLYRSNSLIGTTTADIFGGWSVSVSSLNDASYSVTAAATDVAGNTSTDSAIATLTIDTVAPNAPTMSDITTFSLSPTLTGSGEAGASLEIFDGAVSVGTTTVLANGTWSFAVATLSAGAHSFTAKQSDAASNISTASSPARAISATQIAALIGADGIDNNNVTLSASQYAADGLIEINNSARALLMDDVLDTKSSSDVNTFAELSAIAGVVAGLFETAAGGTASPALTPESLALIGVSGVTAENIDAVLAAISASADDGSGLDSLSELSTLANSSVAGFTAAVSTLSAYDGSNTAPTLSSYENLGAERVSASNLAAINSIIAQLDSNATDTKAEVQALIDIFLAIENAADGIDNDGANISASQFQTIGISQITTPSETQLMNALLDVAGLGGVDSFSEISNLASIVDRLSQTAAGGTPTPALTASDFALIGMDGVTTANLASILSAIAASPDDGSGLVAIADLQNLVNTGVQNARSDSLARISNYDGTTSAPTLSDYVNADVSGVTSSNLAGINSIVAALNDEGDVGQAQTQSAVNAYNKLSRLANGLADLGDSLTASELAALSLNNVNTSSEVALFNSILDSKPFSTVDTHTELAALASAVTRLLAEAAGEIVTPALSVADFVLLGVSGVTTSNLSALVEAIREGADDGSDIDSLAELRTAIAVEVAAVTSAALYGISQYDGSTESSSPTIADYANANVVGVNSSNIGVINDVLVQLAPSSRDSTSELQSVVDAFNELLAASDGTNNNNASLTQLEYNALGLDQINSSGKVSLLNDIVDTKSAIDVDTFAEISNLANAVDSIFLTAAGVEPQVPLTVALFSSVGITGVTAENLSLVLRAIDNTSDDTTEVDSQIEIQALVDQVRADQASAITTLSAYNGSDSAPSLTTYITAGVTGVNSQNIQVVNQFLVQVAVDESNSLLELQRIVNAVAKLIVCADGLANQNCNLTMDDYRVLGYLEVNTVEKLQALNEAMDVIDLTPSVEAAPGSPEMHAVIRDNVNEVVRRFALVGAPSAPVEVSPTTSTTSTTSTTVKPTTPTTVKPTTPTTPTSIAEQTDESSSENQLVAPNQTPVPAGEIQIVVNGQSIDATFKLNADNTALVEIQGGVSFELTPENHQDLVDGLSNALRVLQGSSVSVAAEGLAANSRYEVWLYSEPTLLGVGTTDSNGAISQSFELPAGLSAGNHTLRIAAMNANGAQLSLSLGVIVIDPSELEQDANLNEVETRGEPFDPVSEPKGVIDLVANLVALMAMLAVSGSPGASMGAGRREDEDEEDERGSGEISDVSVKQIAVSGDGDDVLKAPRSMRIDRFIARTIQTAGTVSPMIGRVIKDGVYLRALMGVAWLVLPIAGILLGVFAAINTDFEAVMPSLLILSVLILIGTVDAFSGFLASLTFAALVAGSGGIDSSDSIRGLLGISVLSFGIPMLATALRPFRREGIDGLTGLWDRCADFVLILLFGALAAGSMFSALPGLTGFKPDHADSIGHIQVIAMGLLAVRYILENLATTLTPSRFRELANVDLPHLSLAQQVLSAIVRTAVYAFVAEAFIGNNWALWVGSLIYLVPKIVDLVVDRLPNIEALYRWMPRGILKVTMMMLLARIWGVVLTSNISDPVQMVTFGFVFMGTPSLVVTILGWFGRSSSKNWSHNWLTRIGGLIVLIVGILMVRGVIFAF